MERDVLGIARVATGRDTDLVGRVRITTTKWFAAAVLPEIVGSLGARRPGLHVDITASASWMSLARREADIALRFTRFNDADVIERKVARVTFGLYASQAYVDTHGAPDFDSGCPGHFVATFNEQVTTASDGAYLDTIAHAAQTSFSSNSRDAIARAAAAGAGLAVIPDHLGLRTKGLLRLSPKKAPPTRTVWLGYHADSKSLARVKLITRALTEGLARQQKELAPFPV
jgi:DNA-binding transcriptional LysR family regulator